GSGRAACRGGRDRRGGLQPREQPRGQHRRGQESGRHPPFLRPGSHHRVLAWYRTAAMDLVNGPRARSGRSHLRSAWASPLAPACARTSSSLLRAELVDVPSTRVVPGVSSAIAFECERDMDMEGGPGSAGSTSCERLMLCEIAMSMNGVLTCLSIDNECVAPSTASLVALVSAATLLAPSSPMEAEVVPEAVAPVTVDPSAATTVAAASLVALAAMAPDSWTSALALADAVASAVTAPAFVVAASVVAAGAAASPAA